MPQELRATSLARSAVFMSLDAAGRAEQVERRISDAIVMGVLRNGEKLPSESQLAAQLGVAVVTAREALDRLRSRGLVETRRGRDGGSFVTFSGELRDQLLSARLKETSTIELRDMATQYSAVSGMIAELAVDRASDEDLAQLEETAKQLDLRTEFSARQGLTNFRLSLATLSHSARLVREELRMQAEFGPLLWRRLREETQRSEVQAEMLTITDALLSKDGELARRTSITHIQRSLDWLIAEKMTLSQTSPQHSLASNSKVVHHAQ